jgi:hypothetical protein
MDIAIKTYKTCGLYVSYAPDSGAYSFGGCFEEAVNGLQDELRARAVNSAPTGGGRKRDAQR